MLQPYNYNIYFDFIESYLRTDFHNINRNDPIMQRLEEVMEENNQFFSMADLGKMQFIFNSKRSLQMMGVKPEEFNPGHFANAIHPDDFERFGLARAQVYRIEHDLFIQKKGSLLLASNFRMKNPSGKYTNLLFQCYIFYSSFPKPMVYDLQLYTEIDWYKAKKNTFHFYLGNDMSMFKFPDAEMLKLGPPFSSRELEIIQLVEAGLSSKEIAKKLFLSQTTVSKHRSNILEKSKKASIADLIYELKKQGLL